MAPSPGLPRERGGEGLLVGPDGAMALILLVGREDCWHAARAPGGCGRRRVPRDVEVDDVRLQLPLGPADGPARHAAERLARQVVTRPLPHPELDLFAALFAPRLGRLD